MAIPTLQSSSGPLLGLLYHSYVPKIINAAIDVNLFEILSSDKLSLSELSTRLTTDEAVTEALLDVLIALDLAVWHSGCYALTQVAKDFMLKESGANQLATVKNFSGSIGPFDNLTEVLLNGPSAFNDRMWSSKETILGMEQQQKCGAIQAVLSFVKDIPEFRACRKMCDFAGSIGYFSFAFIQENQELKSHVYDLPEVCALGKELKKQEKDYNRITYHDFDTATDDSFGEGYDFFFSSHFLYEYNAKGTLIEFFKKVNKSMKMGGLFVSYHIIPAGKGRHLVLSIVELMTRSMGYPTHQLPEKDLEAALTTAGFGQFTIKRLEKVDPYPVLLLSAVKIKKLK